MSRDQRQIPFADLCHAKLSFFHYWIFYYLYSADHKFFKAIFKNKFAFVKYLFSNDFKLMRKFPQFADKNLERTYQTDRVPQIPNKCFTVPIVRLKNG